MPFFITLALSTVLGLLSGLGVGGGSLLILWLTLVCKIDYPVAKYMNLLFFLLDNMFYYIYSNQFPLSIQSN